MVHDSGTRLTHLILPSILYIALELKHKDFEELLTQQSVQVCLDYVDRTLQKRVGRSLGFDSRAGQG